MDEPRRPSLQEHLGERAGDRPPPRFGGIIGVVGGVLVAFGVFVLFEELPDDGARVAGAGLCLLLLVASFVAMVARPDGPIHLAGVAAAAAAVTPLVFFVVIDPEGFDGTKGDLTAAFFLAGAIWVGLYLLGPSRGHAIFLAGTLLAVWLIVLVQLTSPGELDPFAAFETEQSFEAESRVEVEQGFQFEDDGSFTTEDDFSTENFDENFDEDFDSSLEEDFDNSLEPVEPGGSDVGAASLVVAAAYLAAAVVVGRRGMAAMATPFLAIGDVALVVGIFAIGVDVGASGAAFLAIVAGGLVVWFASATGRRFTAWFGGLIVGGGILTIVAEATDEEAIAGGVALLLAGTAVVAAAEAVTRERSPAP